MFRFSVRPNQAHQIRWREWGPEAFSQAKEQDKLPVVFLTAFWCGFCQRMDEAALSDDEVIALLNAFFVPIRVEESQRPDIDLRYNQNGWPTIAFLTPDGGHLFSTNYNDPEPFINILVKMVDLYKKDKEALFQSAAQPTLASSEQSPADSETGKPLPLGPALVAEITGIVEGLADAENGGFGGQFKFLHTEAMEFLLYQFETSGQPSHLEHVLLTLDKLRRSKMYHREDGQEQGQEGGAFFRYSSKADWSEPHPEKLLDDQATLLRSYLHAFLLTGDSSHRQTAEEIIDYMESTLSKSNQAPFSGCQDYVRREGEFNGGQSSPLLPVIDEFIYCDANARAASAYLDAWWLLGRDDCRVRAQGILEFLWSNLRGPDGEMFHFWDEEARTPGLLTDAVATGMALLDAYGKLNDDEYLHRARGLAGDVIRMHRNPTGGFSDISTTGPANLRFPLTVLSQNSDAAVFFLRLAALSGDPSFREQAVWSLKSFPNSHRQHGAFAAGFGQAVARLLADPLIVTVTGTPGSDQVRDLARAALTKLGAGNLVLRFAESDGEAYAEVRAADGSQVRVNKPDALTPGLLQPTG